MKKEPEKAGKVLFINAVNDVARKNAQSYLEDVHINKITTAYENYRDVEGFAKVATIKDIATNNYSLSIPLYAREQQTEDKVEELSLANSCADWQTSSQKMRNCYNTLTSMLSKEA